MKGVPPQGYLKGSPLPIFRISFHVGEHIFCLLFFGCETLPPLVWWGGGGACPALLGGWGYPTFASPVNDRHPPPRYPKGYPPPVFRHWFTSEPELRSSPKKGIGRGDPQRANGRRHPPPCLSPGRGVPIWVGRVGGMSPANACRVFPVCDWLMVQMLRRGTTGKE